MPDNLHERKKEAARLFGTAVLCMTDEQYLAWERNAIELLKAAFPVPEKPE